MDTLGSTTATSDSQNAAPPGSPNSSARESTPKMTSTSKPETLAIATLDDLSNPTPTNPRADSGRPSAGSSDLAQKDRSKASSTEIGTGFSGPGFISLSPAQTDSIATSLTDPAMDATSLKSDSTNQGIDPTVSRSGFADPQPSSTEPGTVPIVDSSPTGFSVSTASTFYDPAATTETAPPAWATQGSPLETSSVVARSESGISRPGAGFSKSVSNDPAAGPAVSKASLTDSESVCVDGKSDIGSSTYSSRPDGDCHQRRIQL